MIKRLLGTKDILPEEVPAWRTIEEISRKIFSLYNYEEIRLPLIEESVLFNRSLGQSSEVVQKQMFLIKRDEDAYALRPEGTASLVRAYIENNLDKTKGFVKLCYLGPMFRAERPQKGRLRQFHHIGAEAIGSEEAELDVEVISLADTLLKAFYIDGYSLKINSLGCLKDKKALTENLHKYLKDKVGGLCAECNRRFQTNPLRILDCKNDDCREIVAQLNFRDDYLCDECRGHFAKVKQGLDALKISYEVAAHLVRGLDYYTRTVFEFTHKDLGSQDALGAGGRYDKLVSELGGPDVGAIGFAFGVERLLLVASHPSPLAPRNLVYIISLGQEAKQASLKLLGSLRTAGISCDTDYEKKSLKGALRKANDLEARFVLIIGDDELKKNAVMVKDMVLGTQKEVENKDLIAQLSKDLVIELRVWRV